ncbi:hypothetical protein [Poseidonocella sp. HB161398]|uniref:hypothetical protein n=1 Tax=Poseidonocella sp. HB161398 TaxID=2320855 RepID=UPI0011081A52|nr:hypothetical protein [Poseidonocella sp. HB161398]
MARKLTQDDLERELKDQRDALADTLEQLSGRLGRGDLWAEAAALAASCGRDAGKLAFSAAKANPGRTAAIGGAAALALWGASRLRRRPEPETRMTRFRHRAEEAMAEAGRDTEALVKVLKARLEALELQRDAEDRRRDEKRKSQMRSASGPLVAGLGALAIAAAARALRSRPDAKESAEATMEDLAEELDDLAKSMEAKMPSEEEMPLPNGRH